MAKSEKSPQTVGKRFESDTEKIVHRHLQDQNHEITDEEIKSVRIGLTPVLDQPDGRITDSHEKAADKKTDGEGDIIPGGQKATPWDVIK